METVSADYVAVRNAWTYLFTVGEDWIGLQTMKDGENIEPTFATSRPMTDAEIGKLVREAHNPPDDSE